MINKITNKTIKIEYTFLFLSLIIGLILAMVLPPNAVSDEPAHFFKAWDISEGNIIPKSANIMIPETLSKYYNIKSSQNYYINDEGTTFLDMSRTTIISYSPLPYLANALVMRIGGFFNFSVLNIIYLCRIINLLIYIILVYFAIKIIPILKHTLLLIALMPTTLFIASSVSGDSLTIALSFLTIAMFSNLALIKNKITPTDIFIISILSLSLSLTKPTYALISFLFFIIPYKKFQSITNWVLTFIFSFLIPLSISIIWNAIFKHFSSILDSEGFNSIIGQYVYNITFILSNPFNFLILLINTVIYKGNELIQTFVGFIGSGGQNFFTAPLLFAYAFLVIVLFTSLYDVSDFKLNLKQRLIGLLIFSIIFLAISVVEFITFTPIGSNTIEGLVSRYFIPITPLLFLTFNNLIKSSVFLKNYKIFHLFFVSCIILFYIFIYFSL
jgi:uncharacterized membrane protein